MFKSMFNSRALMNKRAKCCDAAITFHRAFTYKHFNERTQQLNECSANKDHDNKQAAQKNLRMPHQMSVGITRVGCLWMIIG